MHAPASLEICAGAGGVPCPPFSAASRQLGEKDERNLFPEAIRLVDEIRPEAVMLENVRGLLDAVFEDYRGSITRQLEALGYTTGWRLLNASDFGVPQLRPRVLSVAIRKGRATNFTWPTPSMLPPPVARAAAFQIRQCVLSPRNVPVAG